MTRTLWLPPHARVFADKAVWDIESAAGRTMSVIDDFADEFEITVSKDTSEQPTTLIALASGQPFVVGSDSVIAAIDDGQARVVPRKASELKAGQYLYLPKRKLRLSSGTFGDESDGIMMSRDGISMPDIAFLRVASEALRTSFMMARLESHVPTYRGERGGLYLEAKDVDMLRLQLILAAHYGMSVHTTPGDLRVFVDSGRPSCYPSKLMTGLFYQDKATALKVVEEFYGKGIFRLAQKLTDRFLEKVWRYGVVFEGNPSENLVRVVSATPGRRKLQMHEIKTETEDTPVETTYGTL